MISDLNISRFIEKNAFHEALNFYQHSNNVKIKDWRDNYDDDGNPINDKD